jgi:hypothetical protein
LYQNRLLKRGYVCPKPFDDIHPDDIQVSTRCPLPLKTLKNVSKSFKKWRLNFQAGKRFFRGKLRFLN